ncbi:MAG: hypothetical protein ACI8Y4_004025 [Candidatus Poriferisodalaceae bacterium]|jgi:hypothetical protein
MPRKKEPEVVVGPLTVDVSAPLDLSPAVLFEKDAFLRSF